MIAGTRRKKSKKEKSTPAISDERMIKTEIRKHGTLT